MSGINNTVEFQNRSGGTVTVDYLRVVNGATMTFVLADASNTKLLSEAGDRWFVANGPLIYAQGTVGFQERQYLVVGSGGSMGWGENTFYGSFMWWITNPVVITLLAFLVLPAIIAMWVWLKRQLTIGGSL